MATLTVWKFETPDGAERAGQALLALQQQELVQVQDLAYVSWEEGKKKPKTRQGRDVTGTAALGGAFWGLLFGLLFFVPFLGAAIGAATGALAGSLTDVGISDGFIAQVRDKVTPGTSALFAFTSNAVTERVHEALQAQGLVGELIQTNLSAEEEAKLREAFDETV